MKTVLGAVPRNLRRYLIGLVLALSLLAGSLPGAVPRSAADGPVFEEKVTTVTEKETTGIQQADQSQPKEEPPIASSEPRKTSIVAKAGQETEMESSDKKIKVQIPKGAADEDLQIDLVEHGRWGAKSAGLLNVFELNAYATKQAEVNGNLSDSGPTGIDISKTKVNKFKKNLQITIKHQPWDLAGLDTDSLKLCYLNEKTRQWVRVADSKYDSKTGILSATTDHFSYYGEQANPAISGPGRVLASQVDLHSGTASYSYPIELPPGSGGFTPNLELTYNSGIADEMKDKRAVGSWVGIGWTLHLGRISYDPLSNEYYLDLNGASHKLVQGGDGVTYYTLPDTFYKITRSDNTWTMYDTEGNLYRFGGTTDSQQYYDDSTYYRWDLSYMQDTNLANTVAISYAQDIYSAGGITHVRSAYPLHVYYNNNHVDIQFNSSSERDDNPQGCDYNPVPKATETRRLDSIEILVDENLVRKYVFTYDTISSYYSDDYGGICYAGTHTFTSITQKDENDTLSLPTMSFTYQNIQTYLHDTNIPDYVGNPGNPTDNPLTQTIEYSWPHLTNISSGYGAIVSYTYTQVPTATVNNIWTREVVIEKTTDPGIGTSQTWTYSYTGTPDYVVNTANEWDAEYRGFGQVRETEDATGNYTDHWFYTIDANDGDPEKLTGREYETEWRSADDTLLRQTSNDWQWRYTADAYATLRPRMGGDNGEVQFYQPFSAAVDSEGYVYVADSSNNRIQKFTSEGVLAAMWGSYGTGDGQFSNPVGVAAGSDGYIYVTDASNFRIQKFTNSGTFVTKWGSEGSGDGQFSYPYGVAISSDGYVYVADDINCRIQKFTSEGVFVTKWGGQGSEDGEFHYPLGVAVDNSGYVYVADTFNDRIQKFTSEGVFVAGWGGQGSEDGQFSMPRSVAIGSDGYVYVADYGNCRIQKFNYAGYFVTKWGTQGTGDGQFNSANGVALSNDGYVYVVDIWNDRIQKFTDEGDFVTKWGSFGTIEGQFWEPFGIAVEGGSVYVAEIENHRIQKLSSTGAFVAKWGGEGSGDGQFSCPQGMAVGSDGYIYVADTNNCRIQKFTSEGVFVTKWGGWGNEDGQLSDPSDVAVDNEGYVYVADTYNNRIQKFTSAGVFVTKWGSEGSDDGQFSYPCGVAISSDGYVYVADAYNNRIQKFNSEGVFVTKWGSEGSDDGQFSYPCGVAIGSYGYVYVVLGKLEKWTHLTFKSGLYGSLLMDR